MVVEDKYKRYLEFYNEYFIHEGVWNERGNNIPAQIVRFNKGDSEYVDMGDGPINLSHHLQFLYSRYLLGEDILDKITNSLKSIIRLSENARKVYEERYPGVKFNTEEGFFLRDDIKYDQAGLLNTKSIKSSYSNSIEMIDEDVTWSCYVSQDQLWNLAPSLRLLSGIEEIKDLVTDISRELFKYVTDNSHTIYNPYASRILHYWKYIDFSNEGGLQGRRDRRDQSLKYKVKVKRGYTNWYFSYGFRKALKVLGNYTPNKFVTFLSLLWYAPFTFLADRVYYPIVTKFGVTRKDNSYYCLAYSSDCWCGGGKFWKRLVRRSKNYEEDYMWLLIPELIKNNKLDELDPNFILGYLEDYPDPIINGVMNNPSLFLTMYNYYKYILCQHQR